MFGCNTPVREGYFMSQEQSDAVLGRLVRERSDAQKHLALLQAEGRKLGELFAGLGSMVQPEKLWNISLDSYKPYLSDETYQQIGKLRDDIRSTESKLVDLTRELKQFGA